MELLCLFNLPVKTKQHTDNFAGLPAKNASIFKENKMNVFLP